MSNRIAEFTFVVATFKRHEQLITCLESVRTGYPQVKIVVINDDPTDVDFQLNIPNVQYLINDMNQGCPKSRSLGASYVETPYIFFLDDDATIGDVDIVRAINLLEQDVTIAVCGFSARNYISEEVHLSGFAQSKMHSITDHFDTPAFNGGACLVRTNFFLPRGYHPRIGGYGEEAELTLCAITRGFKVVSLRNGGSINHYPTLTASDTNLSRQRSNDVTTAFEYGGGIVGLRLFAAHAIASISSRSFSQFKGCIKGAIKGLQVMNMTNQVKKDAFRTWLRLSRSTATL
jgi:GT2 family glycosyltransferase